MNELNPKILAAAKALVSCPNPELAIALAFMHIHTEVAKDMFEESSDVNDFCTWNGRGALDMALDNLHDVLTVDNILPDLEKFDLLNKFRLEPKRPAIELVVKSPIL